MRTLQSLHKGGHILGLKDNVSFSRDRLCRACVEGKMHDSPHPSKTIISSKRILELLHVEVDINADVAVASIVSLVVVAIVGMAVVAIAAVVAIPASYCCCYSLYHPAFINNLATILLFAIVVRFLIILLIL